LVNGSEGASANTYLDKTDTAAFELLFDDPTDLVAAFSLRAIISILAVQEFSHEGPAQVCEHGHRPARHPSRTWTYLFHQQIDEGVATNSGTINLF
jgi:hypothetical protein